MLPLDTYKKEISRHINQILPDKGIKAADLVYPPNPAMGDLSLPCFDEQKIGLKAEELFSKLSAEKLAGVDSIKLAGKFLNFKLNRSELAKTVLNGIIITGRDYGRGQTGKKIKVLLEYSNANTHKEYHVGHLRNICFGEAMKRVLAARGYKAIAVSYINDFGIHVAKTLWAYQEHYQGKEPKDNRGYFLGQLYSRGAQAAKEDEAVKRLVQMIMKKIESGEGEEYELWQKTRQWSIEQFDGIYRELGVEFEHVFYESEYVRDGQKMAAKLKKKGVFRESEGAVIADLREYGLDVLVVLRSDGTSTYAVADLALAGAKQAKYKPDISLYITDIRQDFYFKQLFKILELAGQKQDRRHLGYDFVKLPDGMMSSRSGHVITYQELKEELLKQAEKETRERHRDWKKGKVGQTARSLAVATMKFEMLKVGPDQEISFDIKQALSFNGYTAAYLLYTYARIQSIFRKGREEVRKNSANGGAAEEPLDSEHKIILKLARYPEYAAGAADNYNPSLVARYLFELARGFNDYYHQTPVLKSDGATREFRLRLLSAVSQVLENGLDLLGIGVIEEM